MKSRLMKALSWAVFPALLVAGFAIAAPDDDNASDEAAADTFELPAPPPGGIAIAAARAKAGARGDVVALHGPGPVGLADGDLTYAEFHSLRDGEQVVTRVDRGTVKSVSEDAVTITHNDDTEVTIPVDSETKVLKPPPPPDEDGEIQRIEPGDLVGDVSDLEAGDSVMVHREEGQPAELIGVLPADGGRPFIPLPPPGGFEPGDHPLPPPPPEPNDG